MESFFIAELEYHIHIHTDAEFGMPVKVAWKPKNERRGTVTDWHFEPADGWKPGPMTPEKQQMKKLCEPVYEWVKTMK